MTTATRTALKNAIIKSFDNCIKDYKNWGLEHTLQYLEDSHIDFEEKDYPFIKQEVINKAKDVYVNPYTTKTVTKKAKLLIKDLRVGWVGCVFFVIACMLIIFLFQNSSQISTKAAEIFQRQKNKAEQVQHENHHYLVYGTFYWVHCKKMPFDADLVNLNLFPLTSPNFFFFLLMTESVLLPYG